MPLPSPDIQHVIFDLGGVIYAIETDLTHRAFAQLLHRYHADYQGVDAQALSQTIHAYEVGKVDTPQFLDDLNTVFGIRATHDELAQAWNALLIGMIPGRYELLHRLAQRMPFVLLSNTNTLHYNYLEPEFAPTAQAFRHIYLSHEIGHRKPNADAFRHVLEAQGWAPEHTLFIDDTQEHILGAQSVGLHTHHYVREADFLQLFD